VSDVFLSYVQQDSAVAEEIALGLRRLGFTAWYYERDSLPGTPWLTQVGTAIEQAGAVLLLISRHSLDSKQVTSEIDYARSKDKPFVPLRFGVSHQDIEQQQRQWAFALGTIVTIAIPEDGPTQRFFARLAQGLENLGVRPSEGQRPVTDDLEERLAQARQMLDDPERRGAAEQAFLQVTAAYPMSARAFRTLGEFYSRSFRFRNAVTAYEKAAELEPGSALICWELGLAYHREGLMSSAAASLRRSVDIGLDPGRERHARTLLKRLESVVLWPGTRNAACGRNAQQRGGCATGRD
jgi:tetratricopeptide (TPR) repeat protein